MDRVLVTAIGSAAADITIKSLHQYGCKVIGTDIYPRDWLVDSSSVDCFYQVPRAVNGEEFITALLDICHREKVQYIIPLTDVEVDVLNTNRTLFAQKEITVCMSDEETISVCRDKRRAAGLLRDCCHTIPEIDKNNVCDWKDFPVICKQNHGRSSRGMYQFSSGKAVSAFLENAAEDYIIQPYIEGDFFTADVIRDKKNDTCAVFVREELLRTANGLGTVVTVFHDEELEELCIKIARRLDIQGSVNFEFIRDDKGEYHFLECNPRFSGGIEFSVLSGYDFVINHLLCFKGVEIDKPCAPREQTIVKKYEEYITKS